jgi:hypothetical protein
MYRVAVDAAVVRFESDQIMRYDITLLAREHSFTAGRSVLGLDARERYSKGKGKSKIDSTGYTST